jgi:hypothetical protein
MMHGPCGLAKPSAPCTVDGVCNKKFPKVYVAETQFANDGYPLYRRKDDGRVVVKGSHVLDIRWVVPYNPYLCRVFRCHINVEICSSVKSAKYLYKCVYKGHDRIQARVAPADEDPTAQDEPQRYLEAATSQHPKPSGGSASSVCRRCIRACRCCRSTMRTCSRCYITRVRHSRAWSTATATPLSQPGCATTASTRMTSSQSGLSTVTFQLISRGTRTDAFGPHARVWRASVEFTTSISVIRLDTSFDCFYITSLARTRTQIFAQWTGSCTTRTNKQPEQGGSWKQMKSFDNDLALAAASTCTKPWTARSAT